MENKIYKTLDMLGQNHILEYMNKLQETDRMSLEEQISSLDLSVIELGKKEEKRGFFEPMYAMTSNQIAKNKEKYVQIGLQAIKNGKIGAIMLAGGQGSRLGFESPKGMFNIGINRELYIFECLMNNLKEVTDMAGAYVPLFIMTSVDNNDETKEFFRKHDFFGYDKEYIWFFVQEQLPTIDKEGKLMLADKTKILTAPNGNGGWYASMERTGMIEVLNQKNIEWLNVFSVDNVLQRIADPCFIGAVIDAEVTSGAKVVAKAEPNEKVGVMCLEDGKPSIVEYYEMTEEMINRREKDGTLSYNYGVILNYLFRVDRLNHTLNVKLPLHRAFKQIKYMNEQGQFISPEKPNAYKFETLALDMVKLQESCLAYEVDRNKEFAPVKNKTGVDSVDTARELLKKNGIEI